MTNRQLSLIGTNGWKLIDGPGSGGTRTSHDADDVPIHNAHGKIGGTPKQLFFLPQDLGERTNLQASSPEKVDELMTKLNAIRK